MGDCPQGHKELDTTEVTEHAPTSNYNIKHCMAVTQSRSKCSRRKDMSPEAPAQPQSMSQELSIQGPSGHSAPVAKKTQERKVF